MTAPERLGRYEIVRRIGKSMADVYLARDTIENRHAALKLIKPDGSTVSELVMEAERRGAAIQKELHLLDPRVVEIYDFGDLEGYFFVAMQYVEGHNLAEILGADGVLGPIRAAVIALEICEQLAKFHCGQAAVVHGDIKPSNIHIGRHDTVRLLDFGIAKSLRANCDATLHRFGSPSYCSPERLSRSVVDQQSDLWAVGATLYEMLSGAPPYRADDTKKLASLIRSRRPPRALPLSCPAPLGLIVSKALAPDPHRRYESARAMQLDLQAFLEHRTTLAESENRRGWTSQATATIDAALTCWNNLTRLASQNLPSVAALVMSTLSLGLALGNIHFGRAHAVRRIPPPTAAAQIAVMAPPSPPTGAVSTGSPTVALKPDPTAEVLPSLYIDAADRIFETYRTSADSSLDHFDWLKAELCLERAFSLGDHSVPTVGELALARGYATLQRVAGGTYSPSTAGWMRGYARDQFAAAVRAMPDSPDPHLALARLYVYSLPDADAALQEFATAQKLGAILGPREIEQQVAAKRLRAFSALRYPGAHRYDVRRRQWP